MMTALALLDLLGISYAADKLVPFDKQATMLGVEISCAEWKNKQIVLKNKGSPSKELLAYVKGLLGCDWSISIWRGSSYGPHW